MEEEKLKTLKDLDDFPDLSQYALKAEAVKWVKSLRDGSKKIWNNTNNMCEFAAYKFITFFNLTEEELK